MQGQEEARVKESGQEGVKENKMGVMPVGRLLFSMSFPIMISMLVQALYNVVDSMFVARVNENALTALSMAFPVQNLMIAVSVGLGVGLNAVLSRALGAKDEEGVRRTATCGILLEIIGSALFMVAGLFVVRPFFEAQTDITQIVEYGVQYTTIVMVGSLGSFMQIVFERLLQSTGRTMFTMVSQAVGAIINIILDPIMIFGYFGMPAMGVAGAALATIIGQWVAAALGLYMNIFHNPEISISMKGFRPHGPTLRRILGIGIPSVVMQSIGSVMTFAMNQILIAFSSTAVAVFGVYFKLQSFIFMPVFGLNNGTVPIVAYNFGARRAERMIKTIRYSIASAIVIMVVGMLIFQAVPDRLLLLFDASEEMLRIGVPALRLISLSFPLAGFGIGCGAVFQALGYSVYSMIISLVRQLFVLIPCAFLIGRLSGNVTAVWWAFVVAEGFSLVLSAIYLRRVNRHVIRTI
ncbi:MAG TPA: MATE family efflux transporter [Candidatus Ventricola intestinavium]|nr:MATE family efflux transporter [Candidatus Ventricola intestinavium]